jgi:hypothetical protein
MRSLAIVAGVVLAGAIAASALWLQKSRAAQAASRSEAELEQPEIESCKQHLKEFYEAWKRYRVEHKGQSPPSVEAMVPQYIKNPDDLMCPTAARWRKLGKGLEQGQISYKGRMVPVTYGFKWLAAGYARDEKISGNQAPLILCTSHHEAMYIVTHGGKRTFDVLGGDEEGKAPQAGPGAVVVVRQNGEIGTLVTGEE